MKEGKSFNILILIERVIFALAFLYFATGEILHLNAFIQNGIDLGLPSAHYICTIVVILTILFSLCILVGIAWHTSSYALILISLFDSFFFFAGHINKINIVLLLFSIVILVNFLLLGCGKYSLSYYLEEKKRKKTANRILFR